MPLLTDRVQIERTFRRCAADPLGTEYHVNNFALPDGLAGFIIERGPESLACTLAMPSKAAAKRALALGPVLHGDLTLHPFGFRWSYDHFGDCVFSSLKSGAYRDAQATEWGTKEVFLDSIDEVRRVLGLTVVPERATPAAVQSNVNTFGATKRRILR
jgi:hypothetical protein